LRGILSLAVSMHIQTKRTWGVVLVILLVFAAVISCIQLYLKSSANSM
jgi:hypothetical protein